MFTRTTEQPPIELPGVHSDGLQKRLRERHRILTQSMDGNKRAPEIRGLRITPNVYTTRRSSTGWLRHYRQARPRIREPRGALAI